MDGLLRLDKFWPKRTNLQTHRRQNLSLVKTGQNRLNKQNFVYLVIHVIKAFSVSVVSSVAKLHFKIFAEDKMNPCGWNLNPSYPSELTNSVRPWNVPPFDDQISHPYVAGRFFENGAIFQRTRQFPTDEVEVEEVIAQESQTTTISNDWKRH